MSRVKLTRETALKESLIKQRIYAILLRKELTVYDLVKELFKHKLKGREYSKKLYERVRHHVYLMLRLGLIKVSREVEEAINKPQSGDSKRGDEKQQLLVKKKYYRAIPERRWVKGNG